MALTWNTDKITDFQTKFPDLENEDRTRQWNEKFMCLLWYNLFTDMGSITEKNHVEFYERIKMYDKVVGCISTKAGVDFPLTYQDVVDTIGLVTNVGNESSAYFIKKIAKTLQEDVKRKVLQEIEFVVKGKLQNPE